MTPITDNDKDSSFINTPAETGAVTFLEGGNTDAATGASQPGWSKDSTLHVIGLCKPIGFVWSLNGC